MANENDAAYRAQFDRSDPNFHNGDQRVFPTGMYLFAFSFRFPTGSL